MREESRTRERRRQARARGLRGDLPSFHRKAERPQGRVAADITRPGFRAATARRDGTRRMNGKLPVAIIWHMHQPYYRHPQTSEFVLPWVRLHASKDYLHMARLLQEFPKVKANFTMVPSLRDQLEEYARGADDEDTRVTMRTVDGDLTPEEKQHMLRRFFSIHHGNVIHRHEEYLRLLQLASAAGDRSELLSDDYFVDLAVWFNLAWIDPDDVKSDARLLEIREAGRRFTREDVRYVIGRAAHGLGCPAPLSPARV